MELIPLIYTVLKIVAVLVVVTLIVSYVSFRNKLKSGTLDAPPEVKQIKKEAEPIVPQVNQIQNKKELLSQPLIRKVAVKEKSKSKSPTRHEPSKGKPGQRKTKSGKNDPSKRLQIIKELQPSKSKKEELKKTLRDIPKTKESLNSLDEDIISKYGENDENGFHVLNVKDRKDKHNK